MDIFWVFILLFGIIVSIGNKASKQQVPTGEEGEPTLSPEEEIERRIRELLEGKPTNKTPQPSPKPTTVPAHGEGSVMPQPSARPKTQPKSYTPTYSSSLATASAHPTGNTLTRPTKGAKITTARGNESTDPIKQGEIKQNGSKQGKIGRILDDFTIEKATIYAEIMRPKHEEY